MDLEKFQKDVIQMADRLYENLDKSNLSKLSFVREQLFEMYKKIL